MIGSIIGSALGGGGVGGGLFGGLLGGSGGDGSIGLPNPFSLFGGGSRQEMSQSISNNNSGDTFIQIGGQGGGLPTAGSSQPSGVESLTTEQLLSLLEEIDQNGDGEISRSELQKFTEKAGGDSCGCSGAVESSQGDVANMLSDNFSDIASADDKGNHGTISVADLMQLVGGDGDFNSLSPADLVAVSSSSHAQGWS